MLNKLSIIKNLKLYAAGASVLALVAFSAYNYTVYLNNKIDALVTDRETLTQIINRYESSTKQLEKTIADNNNLLISEINYLNNTFKTYEGMLTDNKRTVADLTKFISEIQNEEIKTCLNTDLDDEFINRLFSKPEAK